MLNFIKKTMQTLLNYSGQLKTHLDINLTYQEMSYIYQNIRFIFICV